MLRHTSIVSMLLLVIGLISALTPPAATAQAFWRVEETKTNAGNYYYYYVNPGTATIRVQMLGAVRLPGLYEVSEDTDLGQLVALSGGPPMGVHPTGSELKVAMRVYRRTPSGEATIFEQSLDRTLSNPNAYPVLMDGDVIVMDVTQHQRFGWRDATRVISAVGVIALAVERFIRAVE